MATNVNPIGAPASLSSPVVRWTVLIIAAIIAVVRSDWLAFAKALHGQVNRNAECSEFGRNRLRPTL